MALAVGRSENHHHIAEGFLHARVQARMLVRKAAERVAFQGSMPEPLMIDLFITRKHRFYALYQLEVPSDARIEGTIPPIQTPEILRKIEKRRRVGRHVFEGDRHLYMECEVEGPIANPNWGRSRATVRN